MRQVRRKGQFLLIVRGQDWHALLTTRENGRKSQKVLRELIHGIFQELLRLLDTSEERRSKKYRISIRRHDSTSG